MTAPKKTGVYNFIYQLESLKKPFGDKIFITLEVYDGFKPESLIPVAPGCDSSLISLYHPKQVKAFVSSECRLKVENNGSVAWPAQTNLYQVGGGLVAQVGACMPGHIKVIDFKVRAEEEGEAKFDFRIGMHSQRLFGEVYSVKMVVEKGVEERKREVSPMVKKEVKRGNSI